MTFEITGKIILELAQCLHCEYKFRFDISNNIERCNNCGASYKLIQYSTDTSEVLCSYKFDNFLCRYFKCDNKCPLPFMYCIEHCGTKYIGKVEDNIKYANSTIKSDREKINLMKESKKTWMITKLSGINE